MKQSEQEFLKELEKTLWTSADKLRSTLDAAQYKHTVLGLLFIKYVSDSFDLRQKELEMQFRDPSHEYYFNPEDFETEDEYNQEIEAELEIRDYYLEMNVFWVPPMARWENLKKWAKLPPKTKIDIPPDGEYKMSGVGKLIDDALTAIEKDNTRLKGYLNKHYTQLRIDPNKLVQLIDLLSTIPFRHESLSSKDILGHIYEYFLGEFALTEGKKGGQFYTPKAIVTLIVEMLEPFKGRVYDPAMGSGGFFVQSEKFIKEHKGKLNDLSIYGQEYNHTTWQLAAMNMAIRGMDFKFGKAPADTFGNDQHPDLRADFIMANPPFNMKEWDSGVKENDPRWEGYERPPANNANFAWLLHMLYHLSPGGSMGLLLANGSMSTTTGAEGAIRKKLIEKDLVECMVALPGQLFTNTQIPACIWFLTKEKKRKGKLRDRRKEILFIDAREMGYMKDRVLRDFTREDIDEIAGTFHKWKSGKDYKDIPGFCKSVNTIKLADDYILTPGRYMDPPPVQEDNEPYAEKIERLTKEIKILFHQNDELKKTIKKNLRSVGIEL